LVFSLDLIEFFDGKSSSFGKECGRGKPYSVILIIRIEICIHKDLNVGGWDVYPNERESLLRKSFIYKYKK
jgi:hypothetical protein